VTINLGICEERLFLFLVQVLSKVAYRYKRLSKSCLKIRIQIAYNLNLNSLNKMFIQQKIDKQTKTYYSQFSL